MHVRWNIYFRQRYSNAKEAYLAWHLDGRIRYGFKFEETNRTRNEFMSALRHCKFNKNRIRREILLSKLQENIKLNFWKDFRRLNGRGINTSNCIDSQSNTDEILKIFNSHYKGILVDSSCQSIRSSTPSSASDSNYKLISLRSIDTENSKTKASIGKNEVHAYLFKFCWPVFEICLQKCPMRFSLTYMCLQR